MSATMPIVRDDGALGTAFHLRVTPLHIIIGRDGRIQYAGNKVDERLEAALIAARAPVPGRAVAGAVDAHPLIDQPHWTWAIGCPRGFAEPHK